MKKYIKPNKRYFIINVDEPYAEKIYSVLKEGQQAKKEWPEGDISFKEWKHLTFETDGCAGCKYFSRAPERDPCDECTRMHCNTLSDFYKAK